MTSNMGRDVGAMGESTFKTWAEQVGLTVNRAERDRTGWDFLVEFPKEYDVPIRGGALDTQPELPKCFVQVKSTDRKRSSVDVSLSNLERLAKASLPSFILVFEFAGLNSPQRAFLIHFDRDRIADVLKRIRAFSHEHNARGKLHRRRYAVRYSLTESLGQLDGACLLETLRSHIGDLSAYISTKKHWVDDVGYEEGRTRLTLQMRFPVDRTPSQTLVDFSVGLLRDIEIVHGKLEDVRFGIAAPKELEVFGEGGTLQLAEIKPVAEGTIALVDSKGQRAQIRGDIFAPRGVGAVVNKDDLKLVFKSPYASADFVASKPNDFSLQFHFVPFDALCSLRDLQAATEVMMMMGGTDESNSLEVTVSVGNSVFRKGVLTMQQVLTPERRGAGLVVRHAWNVVRHVGVPEEVHVQLGLLLEQERELKVLNDILIADPEDTKLTFGVAGELKQGLEVCVPLLKRVVLGQYVVVVAGAFLGTPVLATDNADGLAYRLERMRFKSLRNLVLNVGEPTAVTPASLLDEAQETFGDGAQVLRWWDSAATQS